MRGDDIPSGYRAGSLQVYDPMQTKLNKQNYGLVDKNSYLSKLAGGDQSNFEEMEAPALRQFQGQLGNLSSRFSQGSGRGSLGNRHSSGFQNTATSAVSNFSQELQGNRQKLQRQAIMDLMGISEQLLGRRPKERTLTQKPSEWWEGPASSFAGGIGQGTGSFLSGLFG